MRLARHLDLVVLALCIPFPSQYSHRRASIPLMVRKGTARKVKTDHNPSNPVPIICVIFQVYPLARASHLPFQYCPFRVILSNPAFSLQFLHESHGSNRGGAADHPLIHGLSSHQSLCISVLLCCKSEYSVSLHGASKTALTTAWPSALRACRIGSTLTPVLLTRDLAEATIFLAV